MASGWICKLHAFARKRGKGKEMSDKDKNILADKLQNLADNWSNANSNVFKNVKDAKWNNMETFEWLWNKYTNKPFDPAEFPIDFKDVRKFEAGLHAYNELISKPKGLFAQKFYTTRAALQNVPELKRFEQELINETGYFRDYSNETNRQVNDFLGDFKKFSLEIGSKAGILKSLSAFDSAGQKELRKVQNEYDQYMKAWLGSKDRSELNKLSKLMRENRKKMRDFYQNGSGEAFEIVNTVLQGENIDTIKKRNGRSLSNSEKTYLNNMLSNYYNIRKNGVTGLVKGLQKIKQMARQKNLKWVDGTVDRINGLIKAIEFQHTVDENGKRIDSKDMQSEKDFLQLGFKPNDRYASNGKVKFSKHYMSQYTLGILQTVKSLEQAVHDNSLSVSKKIEAEIDGWDRIVNVAKPRSPILNPIYDNDPYFFLKKYVSDVGIFNYKVHVKSTFKKSIDAVVNEHLNPAKEEGRMDLVETAEGMKKTLEDTYSEIQHMDPNMDSNVSNMMRMMTSVTYFRLMGGNIRSAARNATQRLYELVEFGFKAKTEARSFYSSHGSANDNKSMLDRQLK